MHRVFLMSLLLCVASSVAPPWAAAARLNYTVYVLAVPVADAVLSIDQTPTGYRTVLRFQTTGVATMVSDSQVEDSVEGEFVNGPPAQGQPGGVWPSPTEYHSAVRLHGENHVVGMTWRDGSPVIAEITPEKQPREDVPAAMRAHTIDPLSSLTRLFRIVAETGRCDASSRAFNGRRLQMFESKTGAEEELPRSYRSSYAGRGIRCDFTEQTLAGFRTGPRREEEARKRRGTIWLGRIFPDAPPLPVRAAFETPWFGDAMIYLTAAKK
jgi:hypothetical protein